MDFLNSKAVKDLRHDPKITPEEGIRRTEEWLKSIYTSINT
jgi:dTDP-glucose 4,6-dehydratase